jgi:hypothetical protein
MDEPVTRPADGSASPSADSPLWALAWLALLAWQLWLTLGLFGTDPIKAITDERLVVNGRHPQNLYLGTLGAGSLSERGYTTVYDPANLAGYLKTPIFDGSRLAELCLLLGGGVSPPTAYKIGLVGICMLVPILLIVACRSAGFDHSTTLLATAIGQLVWWGPLGRGALEAGDSEILLAALAGLAHVGCLIAFHRYSSTASWLGIVLTGCLAWYLQPMLFPIALPLLLGYYLSVGTKHDFLTWHVAFWIAQQGAVLANLYWLIDWVGYWWLRSPLPSAANVVLSHRTFASVWNAPLWGGPADRILTVCLMVSALAGVIILNQTRQRPAARLLAMGAAGALVLALLGISWEPLGQVGTAALLAPALWFAALPASHAWTFVARKLWLAGRAGRVGFVIMFALIAAGVVMMRETIVCMSGRCTYAQPLVIGLNPDRQALIGIIAQHTDTSARILWEDRPLARADSRWAAMLPILTGRAFVGGLDPDGFIEPSSVCLSNLSREGRPIASWKDADLDRYCKRYNIGWVVAWSPAVIERFTAWKGGEKLEPVHDDVDGWLFRVKEPGTFALKGKAELVEANARYITLKGVEPDGGVVVLSLHYQAGMRVSPGRVQIEAEKSGDDFIGFVRLRLAEPAARVTITWQK